MVNELETESLRNSGLADRERVLEVLLHLRGLRLQEVDELLRRVLQLVGGLNEVIIGLITPSLGLPA